MSEANEDKTIGDIREMGGRLAEEVTAFLRKKMDKASKSGGYRNIKLSFVGHAIGNIIIRSALAGSHLGYLYSSNTLFNSGLWLLKKLKGAQCIHQLTLTDDPDLENTFFYKLCKESEDTGVLQEHNSDILTIGWLCSLSSARIELCPASSWDYSKKGHVSTDMIDNCFDQIRAPSDRRTFMCFDVNFDTSAQSRSFNKIIGRA